jgi:ribosome-binding ATPase YchF (GTP1/OBG family)
MSGLEGSALDALLEECSNLLALQKYYTAGPTEVSSWFMKKGAMAPEAAGKIHSKFESKFICAEICKVDDWIKHKDEDLIRRKGIYQRMGKNYIM